MTFKQLTTNDITNTRTLLHEAIPLTGTIVSGTYGTFRSEGNIKNYNHGMFQSVYDYPYLSSSANHIFDITLGVSTHSTLYSNLALSTAGQQSKKKNMYNQMAQILMGFDHTGSVLRFDQDGDLLAGGEKLDSCFILPMARLLAKDEIKKESFSLELGVNYLFTEPFSKTITISDVSASNEYRVNSPVGEYGILYATSSVQTTNKTLLDRANTNKVTMNGHNYWYAGLIFYQAGIVVLTGSVFGSLLNSNATTGVGSADGVEFCRSGFLGATGGTQLENVLTASQITSSANMFRNRIKNLQFNNTTELNSTVYFCRANHNEFNYSSNPTYLQSSKIRVKTVATDNPVSYITTVGLYNDKNELLATAKLSEPLKKDPTTEFTIRARLDY